MTTSDWLTRTLHEMRDYAPGSPEWQWRMNAARTYARIISEGLTETRTADEVLRDAMHTLSDTQQAA